MADRIIIDASPKATSKLIEYEHPITKVWQDSNILLNITSGSYVVRLRLKGSNPQIVVTTSSITVENSTPPASSSSYSTATYSTSTYN